MKQNMRQFAVTEIQYGTNSFLAAVLSADGTIEELELERKEKTSETGIVYSGITESVNKSVGGGFLRAGKRGPYYLPRRKHEKLRVVIRGIGLAKETANLNNEFEVFLGGSASPEPTPTPDPLPLTGDSGSPMLWLGLILLGLISLLLAGAVYAGRRKKK